MCVHPQSLSMAISPARLICPCSVMRNVFLLGLLISTLAKRLLYYWALISQGQSGPALSSKPWKWLLRKRLQYTAGVVECEVVRWLGHLICMPLRSTEWKGVARNTEGGFR